MSRDTTTIRIKRTTKERLDIAARLFTADIFIQALLNLWDVATVHERNLAIGWDDPQPERRPETVTDHI